MANPNNPETEIIETEERVAVETSGSSTEVIDLAPRRLASKQIAAIVILAVLAVVSFFGLSTWATDEGNFSGTYQVLTEKQNAVLGMTTASAAAATAITVLPGDIGTPVADEMADLSGYFIFILCAIFLEKWLLTTFGLIAFKAIIPLALIAIIISIVIASKGVRKIAIKMMIFAVILFLIVPVSALITKQIDESYEASVNQTIYEINADSEELSAASDDENLLEQIINKFKNGAIGVANTFKEKLTSFTEYVAHMIVTSCVIPIAVILVIIWLIKMITGLNFKVPVPKGSKVMKKIRK